MRLTILILSTLTILSGCTAVHETLLPHRELLSPCACEEDATPINGGRLAGAVTHDTAAGEVRV